MSNYYNVVPWYNSAEWHNVREKIYSLSATVSDKEEALNLLLIWKARCPSLPSGIESTLCLLQVIVEDEKASNETLKENVLRLAYSSAIMRFVNHMLDAETAKGSSLYKAAKSLDLPDWLIDLRHDTAHNSNIPSIELLRDATSISIEWLKVNYWDKHKEYIKDYLAGESETEAGDNKIAALMNFYLSLSICAHPKCKLKCLANIPDMDMRDSIVNEVREFFGDNVDLSNLKTVSINALINMLKGQSMNILKDKDAGTYMTQALLGKDSLFISLELLELLEEKDFSKHGLSKHYMQCFEVLLTFIHENDLILHFILELISLTQNEELESKRRELAAKWVSEILKALNRSKLFLQKLKKTKYQESHTKKRKEIQQLFLHWFPNENKCRLLLNLEKGPPDELANIHFIQSIISSYNPYLTHFIRDLFKLLDPELPRETVNNICTLADIISHPEKFDTSAMKVYTVDDLKSSSDNFLARVPADESDDSDCAEICDESLVRTLKPPGSQLSVGIWKLTSNDREWSSCPIGLLPWQQSCDTESMDVEE